MTTREEFKQLIDIACNTASIYKFTQADSLQEAILKLNIFGQSERADQFEQQINFVYNMYKNDNKTESLI